MRCFVAPLSLCLLCLLSTAFGKEIIVKVKNKESMIHIGSLDSFELTPRGIEAGRLLWQGIKNGDKDSAARAIALYKTIIPEENFGGEYSALQWLAECYLDPGKINNDAKLLPLHIEFYHFFMDNDCQVLKEYLAHKYKLERTAISSMSESLDRVAFLEDYVLFNNPYREQWERTSEITKELQLKKGDVVADIGCGPGLYSYLMSSMVGETGKVYAMDIKDDHLKVIAAFCQKYGIGNVHTHLSGVTSLNMPDNSIDVAYLCSLYHIIYAEAAEERDAFVESIKAALKPGGRLCIVDNSPVDEEHLPYHGNYIDMDLVIAQLEHYAFTLTRKRQIIPQRYFLEFTNEK